MIITKLMGGHSNQLFQYAVGRRLAIKHDTILKLDLSWFDGPFPPGTTPRHYELGAYPINAEFATHKDLENIVSKPSFWSNLSKRSHNKIYKIQEGGPKVNRSAINASDNVYLEGYWQNEAYFNDIRNVLLNEFEPVKPMTKKNQKYLELIQSCEAVSLHVRREDYVNNPVAHAFHGLKDNEYYKEAIRVLKQQLGGKQFKVFVFSKEIDWCKKNLDVGEPLAFIEGNKDGSDDMRLMKHCKHNILANSSFSWWGAWLNQNLHKIVIAPKIWFLDEQADKEADIIPREWIKL